MSEFQQRFAIFQHNVDRIEQHNAEAASGKHYYTLGINQFADMTTEEFHRAYLSYRKSTASDSTVQPVSFVPSLTLNDVPASLDWRDKKVVSEVKDQGQCGSCWAFSAVGAMEGAHALATGNLVSLSEQELVDCVNGGADTCDVGGEMQDGFKWAISAGGMETESDYPYEASSGNKCAFTKTKSAATFSGFQNVTSGDEKALLLAIAERPTISVAIDASQFSFQFYMGGVYDEPSCKTGVNDLDHGVLVVGYGTDSGKDYWIVKNSWGSSWGKSGYIWMSRNKSNQCGIATDASFPLV